MITRTKYANREEWLAIRKNSIGGSDAGAVIGMNPHKSAYTLWAEKTGKIAEFDGNLTTEVGAYLEELVAKVFERETGKKVRRDKSVIYNSEYPFAHATIDRRVVGEDAILEIKTTNSVPIMKAIRGSDDFPEAYYAQCVHYLAVTGAKVCYLAVLINCRDFKRYKIERDEAEIAALMIEERKFWSRVEADEPPAMDGSDSTSDTVSALYPDSDDTTVDLTLYESLLYEIIMIDKQIKELKELKESHTNEIKAFMKESGLGESEHFKVSWKEQTRPSFDFDAFKADHDIDLAPYYKSIKSRPFRPTQKKG